MTAAVVDALADTISVELDGRDEAAALSTQANLSAVLLAALPVGFVVVGAIGRSGSSAFLFGEAAGRLCLAAGLLLDTPGARRRWCSSAGGRSGDRAAPVARRAGRCPVAPAVPWLPLRRLSARSSAALAVGVAALAVGVWGLRRRSARRRRNGGAWSAPGGRRRRRELAAAVAEAVPLLQLAVQSGLTRPGVVDGHRALVAGRAGRRGSTARSPAARPACRWPTRSTSWADRLGRGVLPLTTVLAAADRYGAPLGGPLERLGGELRLQRRRQLETAARRLPVMLLFPLVAGVLPAFVCLAVVPLVASSLQGLSLGGG